MERRDEESLFARLVELADTLVEDFDVVELADRLVRSSVEFLPVSHAALMLVGRDQRLRLLASTSEESRLLELYEVQNNEGPCLDALETGTAVLAHELATDATRWPRFTAEARDRGVVAAYAVPMRLREHTIGALNLFCTRHHQLDDRDIRVAEVMTRMATLGILNHWTVREKETVATQLQAALDSRMVIEQAKGVIAERSGVSMATAFDMLRSAARDARRPLSEVAAEVASGGSAVHGRP